MSLDARRRRAAFALARLFTFATFATFASVAAAPFANAQTTDTQTPAPAKKPKKPKKPAKPAPAPAEPPADTAPPPAPAPPPVETAPPPPPAETAPPPAAPVGPAAGEAGDSMTDVYEKPAKTYYFVGLRYRGTIIPKFMINIFADEGATVYSNTIGLELDIRRDNFSMIPSIAYTSYGFGDTLFKQKGADPTQEFNYTDVNSSLKGVYLGADLFWSKQISTNFSFEYGAGFGIGAIFGSLTNDWVTATPGGPLTSSTGTTYAPCMATSAAMNNGCNPQAHTSPNPVKVNGYTEPNWLSGGSIPVVFPHIAIPELGIRYKPIKQLETRLVIGFSLTGFFFGLSGDYGLEKTEKPAEKSAANR